MRTVHFYRHGGPEVLEIDEVPTPFRARTTSSSDCKPAALNHADLLVREGWPGLKLELPHIPGADGAGTIAAVGSRRAGLRSRASVSSSTANLGCGVCAACLAGQDNLCREWHLLGETVPGTYAEAVVVPARNVLRLPDGFDEHAAAAASLVFLTAWHSLITRGRLQAGETVLIVGASGGVNTACHPGGHVWPGRACSSSVRRRPSSSWPSRWARRFSSIAASTRTGRRRSSSTAAGAASMSSSTTSAPAAFPHSLRAARKGGRILTVGNTGGPLIRDRQSLRLREASDDLIGSTMGTLRDFATVMGLVFEGQLHAVLDRTYPLGQAAPPRSFWPPAKQIGKITLASG